MKNSPTEAELLEKARNGTMNERDQKDLERMMNSIKKEVFIAQKGIKIWKGDGKDGRWKANLKLDNGKWVSIRRANREELIELVYDRIVLEDHIDVTFETEYNKWRKRRLMSAEAGEIQYGTISVDDIYWEKYYKGSKLVSKMLTEITSLDIEDFINKNLAAAKRQGNQMNKAKYFNMIHIANSVMKLACKERIITDNPCLFIYDDIKKALSKKRYEKDDRERVIGYSDFEKIKAYLDKLHAEDPKDVRVMAYMLYTTIGCRLGEALALQWSDCNISFDDDSGVSYLAIRDTIHYNYEMKEDGCLTINGETLKGTTKTGAVRYLPITDSIRNILTMVKDAQRFMGMINPEFVFADRKGRKTERSLSQFVSKVNRHLGINRKGVSCVRRTCASIMGHKEHDPKILASILGHSVEVDKYYYQYDMSETDKKMRLLGE